MKIFIMALLLLTIFVVQQSHLIVTVKSQKAGITVDECQIKWENLKKYFKDINRKIDRTIHRRH